MYTYFSRREGAARYSLLHMDKITIVWILAIGYQIQGFIIFNKHTITCIM